MAYSGRAYPYRCIEDDSLFPYLFMRLGPLSHYDAICRADNVSRAAAVLPRWTGRRESSLKTVKADQGTLVVRCLQQSSRVRVSLMDE